MKAWGWLGVFACAMAAMLTFSVAATAKPGYLVSPPYFSFFADLPMSNGYTVLLAAGHREVALIFDRNGETAAYVVNGRVNSRGVDADFGRFGALHARFTGVRREREPLFPGCQGQRRIEVHGRLAGSLRFRAERGFVTVSSNRVKASYEQGFRETCHFGPESEHDNQMIEVLEATGKTPTEAEVSLKASYLDSIGSPLINASIIERLGRVTALKRTTTIDEDSELEFSPALGRPSAAAIKPTLPFTGSATYAAFPGGHSEWSGDLRVRFAGLGTVDLTGPGFHADACRIRLANQSLTCAQQRVKASPDRQPSTAAAPTPSPWRWPGFPR